MINEIVNSERPYPLPYSDRISPWVTEFGPLPWKAKQTTSALCQLEPATIGGPNTVILLNSVSLRYVELIVITSKLHLPRRTPKTKTATYFTTTLRHRFEARRDAKLLRRLRPRLRF